MTKQKSSRPSTARKPEAGRAKPTQTKSTGAPRKAVARKSVAKPKSKAKTPRAPRRAPVLDVVLLALGDLKAQNVTVLDVRELTTVTDTIVIASGTSDRHVKSLAGSVVSKASQAGYRAFGREGERDGEWVLVDLSDVIVHVMLPRVREFYGLEKLWDVRSGERSAGA